MSLPALQEYTRIAKYARYLEDNLRRETWDEQISRVFNMHRTKYKAFEDALSLELQIAEKMVRSKKVLGSQRVLQFGGKPVLDKNARLYNCTMSYLDRVTFFKQCMFLLLCGCGTGFSVQKHHVAKLPAIQARTNGKKVFVIPDTIEGWSDALGCLVASYFGNDTVFSDYFGFNVEFDYSLIRKKGAPLSSGAKAPGPEGLKTALQNIQKIFEKALQEGVVNLRSIHVYDIVMHAANAVISGGVRRSATIALFSPDDEEMAKAKTGNWMYENPQRGRSNNSALLIRGETTHAEFKKLMEWVREYGEPGFVWSDSTELLVNPCVEIGSFPVCVETGESGWQFCNLCEINGKKCKTEGDFLKACEAASILATLQAGYTDFEYLGGASERITRREALLGVSITGMMDQPEILFNPEIQKKGALLVREVNERIAKIIGINPAARATCVKPAGSSSCILGTASGIHPHHAKRYFRRVQANVLENPLMYFKKFNPRAVEKSVWDPNGETEVVTFLCDVPKGSKTKNQVGALDLLQQVRLTQQNWVTYGTNEELCTQPWLRHNVSNTINVKEDEWEAVTDFIYENRQHFAGISLLPHSGDKDFPQAPFVSVPTSFEILREYGSGSMFASGIIEQALQAYENNLWKACDHLMGKRPPTAASAFREEGIRQFLSHLSIGYSLSEPSPYLKEEGCFVNNFIREDDSFSETLSKLAGIAALMTEDLSEDLCEELKNKFLDTLESELQNKLTYDSHTQECWLRSAKKFANSHFDGNIKKMVYCLKDVYNLKLWEKLSAEYQEVPWEQMVETEDGVDFQAESACAGGACEIPDWMMSEMYTEEK